MNNKILTSTHCHLRPVEKRDLNNMHTLHSMPETDQFNTLGIPSSIDETEILLHHWTTETNSEHPKKYYFVIELNVTDDFVGLAGINIGKEKYKNAEIWFKIHPHFWNRGLATQTAKRLIDFGFQDLQLHRIEAGCAVDNIASVRVLEKIGMTREAHTRKLLPLKSGWADNYGYAILHADQPV
jgi:[ribosomal protein S5]-alanine N-acetyltransferase